MAGRRQRPPADPEVPMVFDGYSGGFVPVDAASFDVTLEPEAVVLLPLSVLDEQRTAAAALERRQQARAARRARPRCDAGDHQVQAVTRATACWLCAATASRAWSSPPSTARQ